MTQNRILGSILSALGAVLGLILTPILFILTYGPLEAAEFALGGAGLGCAEVVKFIMPIVSDIGIIAGGLYAVSAIGFLSKNKYAFPLAVVANVLALNASFWPIIPTLVTSLDPLFIYIFMPNLLIFFFLMTPVGKVRWKTTLFGFVTGIAWVLSFMNGVAATNRIVMSDPITGESMWIPYHSLFVAMQRVNWIAAIGWGVVTVALILRPKDWVRQLGLGAGILEVVAGFPTGIFSPFGGFSLFLLGPILSLVLVVIFAWPNLWKRLASVRDENEKFEG